MSGDQLRSITVLECALNVFSNVIVINPFVVSIVVVVVLVAVVVVLVAVVVETGGVLSVVVADVIGVAVEHTAAPVHSGWS